VPTIVAIHGILFHCDFGNSPLIGGRHPQSSPPSHYDALPACGISDAALAKILSIPSREGTPPSRTARECPHGIAFGQDLAERV
jgi:hypothetical protein